MSARTRSGAAIASVLVPDCVPLNAGSCRFDPHLEVVTDPGCGGYSALIPVVRSDRGGGPVLFRCDLVVQDGSVGLCAVTSDCRIIAERVASRTGRQQLDIIVFDLRDVAGILVRNSAVGGRRSRVLIDGITAEPYPVDKILYIRRDRPSRVLSLPLRRQINRDPPGTAETATTLVDLDVATVAAVVVDAWMSGSDRVASNIRDKLDPTLTALRSTGMAILHAAHDRDTHPLARPLAGETVIPGEFHDVGVVADMLRDAGIRSLVYLGYFSNACILWRAIGMLDMHRKGFDTILVRDASIARESAESIAGEWFHKSTVHFVELNFGATTTAAEIQAAVAAMTRA